MTQSDLIADALTEIGVNSVGEIPNADDLRVASRLLSKMLDAFDAVRQYTFTVQRVVLAPLTLKQVYSVGPSATADFNIPRPAKINRYSILNLSNPIIPIELPLDSLTEAQWQSYPSKNIGSALPQVVWDDQQFPLRNLTFFPVPTVNVNFVLYVWQALSTWPDYVTDLTFPPGYAEFFTYELAFRCVPSFGAAAHWTPISDANYRAAKNRVMVMNTPILDLKCDPMLQQPSGRIYNWLTDNANVGSGG